MQTVLVASEHHPWLAIHPPQLRCGGSVAIPSWTQPDDAPLVTGFLAGLALERAIGGYTAGSSVSVLAEHEIPTMIFGPGDLSRAYAAEEHVEGADVLAVTRVLAHAIARIDSMFADSGQVRTRHGWAFA